ITHHVKSDLTGILGIFQSFSKMYDMMNVVINLLDIRLHYRDYWNVSIVISVNTLLLALTIR
ncbi:hypothetical protein, partial [Staphylococcus aureus]